MRTRLLLASSLIVVAGRAAAQQAPLLSGYLSATPVPAAAPGPALHLPQGQHITFNRYSTGLLTPGLAPPGLGVLATGGGGRPYRPVAPALGLVADVLTSALLPYSLPAYRPYQAPVLAPAPTAFRLGTQP